ncbi:Carbamoyltransferase [Bosea sp. 62]|nr:Carbamoyltransferase [Bosea sp. 21B]CAD5263249.1 Carbamoyltransferase [Bosea sp. 7B]CAD5271452.1 Carbamoyltransferase [Bosea sp. 46]VVT43907.1 Carbamoyltransferase [Bosea sp. EC-HK365B]VXB17083.1 Carbamoyltransferase [Bosea sp. 29B]VXB74999.1 Carbamoyltransferase [Bosea sp. 62]VXC38075.1 Carbamoyltransferase [Bosea sp. 127]VXC53348.1 Carbamoyltransferase [Bosea sp. 125]
MAGRLLHTLPAMSYTIGLATTFHDPAIAIVNPSGEVLFAEAAERYLQYKRAPNCEPDTAVRMESLLKRYIPKGAEIRLATSWGEEFTGFLDQMSRAGSFSLDSLLKLSPAFNRSLVPERSERALIANLHHQQQRAGLGTLLGLDRAFGEAKITGMKRYGHHLSHAAYASWSSPFRDAACLAVDGMGETGASAIFALRDGRLTELKRHRGRESIGFYFGFVTDLAGFDQAKGEEWKIMGLAPYGRSDPELLALLRKLYRVEGTKLTFADAATVQNVADEILARRPADALDKGWADLSRCGQDVFAEMMEALLAETAALCPSENLVLAGGCALNSSFNGKIVGRHGFKQVYVPSAPADDGNAIGAAWLAHAEANPDWQAPKGPMSPYLGSSLSTEPFERMAAWEPRLKKLSPDEIITATAKLLAEGKLIGWAQGRAEFGPRALGNRSILADPRPANAKDLLNAKVKYREAFRPFAPSILAEHGPDWFENYQDAPYMERTLTWKEAVRSRVPAVVHEDSTGRLQSVTAERNPRYHALITAFHEITGVPVILNTSFNIMGKPILHTSEDAILMFYTSGLDALVVEDWLLVK